jgi:hypothetical protein
MKRINGQVLDPKEIAQCTDVWLGTLKHFKIYRPVLPYENMKIAQLVKQYGYIAAMYALTGMRFEKKTDSYDPGNYLAIARAFDSKLFEVFVNLAGREKSKTK